MPNWRPHDYQIRAIFTAFIEPFQSAMKQLVQSNKDAQFSFKGLADHITGMVKVFGGMLMYRAFGSFVRYMQDAIDRSKEFSMATQQLAALTGDYAGRHLPEWIEEMRSLGKEYGISSVKIAEGAREIAAAGFSGSESLGLIRESARLATIGLTDMDTASRIVVTAINQFGYTAEDASKLVDEIAIIANKTTLQVEDLGVSMGYVGPIAAQCGLTFQETAVALGVLRDSGLNASQAGTNLRQMLTQLISPSEEVAKMMYEYGITVRETSDVQNELAGQIRTVQVENIYLTEAIALGEEALASLNNEMGIHEGNLEDLEGELETIEEKYRDVTEAVAGFNESMSANSAQMKVIRRDMDDIKDKKKEDAKLTAEEREEIASLEAEMQPFVDRQNEVGDGIDGYNRKIAKGTELTKDQKAALAELRQENTALSAILREYKNDIQDINDRAKARGELNAEEQAQMDALEAQYDDLSDANTNLGIAKDVVTEKGKIMTEEEAKGAITRAQALADEVGTMGDYEDEIDATKEKIGEEKDAISELNEAIDEQEKKNEEMAEQFKANIKLLGELSQEYITSGGVTKDMKGIIESLGEGYDRIVEQTGSVEKAQKFLDQYLGTRAGTAVAALSAHYDRYKELLEATGDEQANAAEAEKILNTIMASTSKQFQTMEERMAIATEQIVAELIPAIQALQETLIPVLEKLADFFTQPGLTGKESWFEEMFGWLWKPMKPLTPPPAYGGPGGGGLPAPNMPGYQHGIRAIWENQLAYLHRGEAVLTRPEAADWFDYVTRSAGARIGRGGYGERVPTTIKVEQTNIFSGAISSDIDKAGFVDEIASRTVERINERLRLGY